MKQALILIFLLMNLKCRQVNVKITKAKLYLEKRKSTSTGFRSTFVNKTYYMNNSAGEYLKSLNTVILIVESEESAGYDYFLDVPGFSQVSYMKLNEATKRKRKRFTNSYPISSTFRAHLLKDEDLSDGDAEEIFNKFEEPHFMAHINAGKKIYVWHLLFKLEVIEDRMLVEKTKEVKKLVRIL